MLARLRCSICNCEWSTVVRDTTQLRMDLRVLSVCPATGHTISEDGNDVMLLKDCADGNVQRF